MAILRVLALLIATIAAAQSVPEYDVKAAFLYSFAKFVEWPASSGQSAGEPIRFCVLGKDPFGSALSDALSEKKIGDRPLTLTHLTDVKEISKCQVAFIAKSERKNLAAIFAAARASSVLTVGESEDFAAAGGVIGFQLEEGKIRLEINLQAAGQQQLRMSSKLLSLAQIVKKP